MRDSVENDTKGYFRHVWRVHVCILGERRDGRVTENTINVLFRVHVEVVETDLCDRDNLKDGKGELDQG